MQPRHRRGEAQPQPRARLRAALLEAHEALDRAAAIGLGNAAAAVGDREQDALALAHRLDHDLGLGPVHAGAIGRAVFDGVVDQIGERLADELAVAVHRSGGRRLDLELDALVVGERLVELAHAARDLGRIDLRHAVARLARFRPRDHEQRIEGADQRLGFLDRALERLPVLRFVLGEPQGLLAAVAQPGQRRLEIMGDIVGHLLEAAHERLDALEHEH